MKISIKSLNSYLKKPLSTEDMVIALERTEVEVEEILYATKVDPKVVTAKITKMEPHPNADRLKLVTIDAGSLGTKKLVCGGANARVGLVTAYAQVGTILPDGIEIKDVEIRGESSAGMLCTERELGYSDEHSGLIELDPSLPLGKSLCDIDELDDCLDITTPSNRWDYLSLVGLAREISAFSDGNSLVEPVNAKNVYKSREAVKVKNREVCKRFVSVKCVVKNNNKSPQWLVDNLEANGMNSINPVVDITNWIMLEYGQPSHAFAADKISGSIQVRYASPAEKLKLLNSKEISFTNQDLVIADDDGALDLAGVMGGQRAEVEPNTTEIMLTVANFDKTSVRRASLRHGVRTEASARFERGLPLPLPLLATDRILVLLKEICDARVVGSPVDQLFGDITAVQIDLRIGKAEKILGMKLDERLLKAGLEKRGFSIEPTKAGADDKILAVEVPWWRIDVSKEEDLFEEAAKIVGYENMPTTLPELPPMDTHEFQLLPQLLELKQSLVSAGCMEIMTYSLVSADMIEATGGNLKSHLHIVNPLVKEQAYLRNSLLASHLKAVGANKNYHKPIDVFELSRVSLLGAVNTEVVEEDWRLAITCVGPDSLSRLRVLLGSITGSYLLTTTISRHQQAGFIEGRTGVMECDSQQLMSFGQVSPTLLRRFGAKAEVSFAEIEISELLAHAGVLKPVDIPPYQYVDRTLALELDENVLWQQVSETLTVSDHVAGLSFVESYQDDELKKRRRKSLTVGLELDLGPRPTSIEVNTEVGKLVKKLQEQSGMTNLSLR